MEIPFPDWGGVPPKSRLPLTLPQLNFFYFMNYLDYIAHYSDVVMHAYIRYKDYTNYLLYIEPYTCMQAIKELQSEAQFGFSVNKLKRLLLADGLDRLDERIQIMGWEMTDTDYKCLLQLRQSENDFYKERLNFFTQKLGDKLGQEYATRLYATLMAITWNTTCILEMKSKLLGYVSKSKNQRQTLSTNTESPQFQEILKNPEMQGVFSIAISKGLMDDKFDWKDGKGLLAIFCGRLFLKFLIGQNPELNQDGEPKIEWRWCENMFKIKGKDIEKGRMRGWWRDAINKNPPKKLFLLDNILPNDK